MNQRRKEITNLYKNRNELTTEKAEELFCKSDVLEADDEKFHDGVKLCAFLLLEKLNAAKAWNLIREIVVISNPASNVCLNIGDVLRRSYRDSSKSSISEGVVTRQDVSNFIFKPLMKHCILVKRKYSENFLLILRGATMDRDESMSQMLFEMSAPVVWRYLNAKNANIRMGAFQVQRSVFPPSCDDPIRVTDYFNKHCDAFIKALQDPVVEVCTQAIEEVCEIVSMYYEQISADYVDQIFEEFHALASDEVPEIRAALYRGLRYFHECAAGFLRFKTFLKQVCMKGIDDVAEKVRCNIFRLLNAIHGSNITIISTPYDQDDEALLSLKNVLYRLDYEECEGVEREISCLLFLNLFDRDMSSQARYSTLSRLCRLNRNACLNMHRLLYTLKVVDTSVILSHLAHTLSVCVRMLKTAILKQSNLVDKRLAKYDFENYVINGDVIEFHEKNDTNEAVSLDQFIKRFKDVVDCMVVCYATMRYDPKFQTNSVEVKVVARHFSEIANEIITTFESQDDLLDTALSVIALVRSAGIHTAKLKNNCTKMLRAGQLNARYLEIFGLVEMNELLKLLQNGMSQLERSLCNVENVTQRKRPISQTTEFFNKRVVVDALAILLNLPSCNQYIVEKYLHYITGFIDCLERICDNFMMAFKKNMTKDMSLFLNCWRIRTIMLIIFHNKSAFVDNKASNKPAYTQCKVSASQQRQSRRKSSMILSQIEDESQTDPMLEECKWFENYLKEMPELSANSDLVEHFYHTVELHFQAYKHMRSSVRYALTCIKKLQKLSRTHSCICFVSQPYQACLKAGDHALKFSELDSVNYYMGIFEEEAEDY